jgi:hypothetical protein
VTARPAAGALGERVARRIAAGGAEKADGFALAVLAWSERTGTERAVFAVEKRLSGLLAAVFGRWAVLGSLDAEEIAPGVLSLTLASRVDDDGRLSELAVELERGGEPLWSVLRAPGDPGVGGDPAAVADRLAVVDDWPDATQALIDWWGEPRGDA